MNAALSVTDNKRIAMGGNNPPAIDAHKANIDDLRAEAAAWLDGAAVKSADEAEGIDTLIKLARSARDEADKARAAAKKPHDDAAKAVQAEWKPLVDTAQRILDVCLQKVGAWRQAEADRKAAEAAKARAAAEAERAAAEAAMRNSAGDLAAREQAEQQVEAAKMAEKVAKKADKAATSGLGLRTKPVAVMTDLNAAIKHYWAEDRNSFAALVTQLAEQDVRRGIRNIPGFRVDEVKVAL